MRLTLGGTGTPLPLGFTGAQSDSESGLLYLQARYYDPTNGRFLSQDPLSGVLPNPQSQQPYTYAQNNPQRYLDPGGKCVPDSDEPGDCSGPGGATMPSSGGPPETPPADPEAGLPTIDPDSPLADPQVQQTVQRIAGCGPFPYAQDGTVFKNNGNPLPVASQGYYHEYTVDTPGAPNRGIRRIVTGAAGETYYTDDHYATFTLLDPATVETILNACRGGISP